MGMKVLISEVHAEDSAAIAEIHMTARRGSMPYLPQLHSDEETHEWFVRRVASGILDSPLRRADRGLHVSLSR